MSAALSLDLATDMSGVYDVAPPSTRAARETIYIAAWIAGLEPNVLAGRRAIHSFIGWLWHEQAPTDAPWTDRDDIGDRAIASAVERFDAQPEVFATPERAKGYCRGIVEKLWKQYILEWSGKAPPRKGSTVDVAHRRGVPRFDDENAGQVDDEGEGVQWPGEAPDADPWAYGAALDDMIDRRRAAEQCVSCDGISSGCDRCLARWYDDAIEWAETEYLERYKVSAPELLELDDAAALRVTESVGQAVLVLICNGWEVPRLRDGETPEEAFERCKKALEKKVYRAREMSPRKEG